MNNKPVVKMLVAIICVMISTKITLGDSSIDQIREQYKSAKNSTQTVKVEFNVTKAAIGQQHTTITFHTTAEQAEPEGDPYKMNYDLHLVSVDYSIAASSFHHKEYLYSSGGQLIFYYETEDGFKGKIEKRYYFNNGELIKVIIDGSQKYTDTKKFKNNDLNNAQKVKTAAINFKKMFSSIIVYENTGH